MSELASQRESDAKRFGAKAANLGEVARAARMGKVQGITVPSGFSIPFVYYVRFIAANGLEEPIVEMLANHRFNHDPKYRRERLATLRARIESARLDPAFAHSVVARVRRMFGARGVFVRSSTNAEDLEHFSGAGLYTTVPNVRGDEQLLVAIRRVWASIWNYEAYEARERAGINHAAVYPSVLIQEGIPAEAAGVLITRNPFDKDDHESVYINAKRGLGIRVVEGHSVPEQLIFDPRSRAVRVLTRSDDDTMLQFNKRGGVRELQIETQTRVLGPGLAARLARAALEIKGIFGKDQDIEWVTVQERIFIVQSRPFVD
jgi:phosphoenolpyruvate synthase/pyruvate phosphate dikinase